MGQATRRAAPFLSTIQSSAFVVNTPPRLMLTRYRPGIAAADAAGGSGRALTVALAMPHRGLEAWNSQPEGWADRIVMPGRRCIERRMVMRLRSCASCR
jgi:hypothetical protein